MSGFSGVIDSDTPGSAYMKDEGKTAYRGANDHIGRAPNPLEATKAGRAAGISPPQTEANEQRPRHVTAELTESKSR